MSENEKDLLTRIANMIRGRRNYLGLTLEEVGAKAGVARNTVWAIEKNEYDVKMLLVFKVLNALDLKVLAYTNDGEFNQVVL